MFLIILIIHSRTRWKSLESVTQVGWAGSAALGGYLADQHGYVFTFLITAALQFTGTLAVLILAPIVEAEKSPAETLKANKSSVVPGEDSFLTVETPGSPLSVSANRKLLQSPRTTRTTQPGSLQE